MLILGAGGHSKEVLEVLTQCNLLNMLFFYEDMQHKKDNSNSLMYNNYKIIRDLKTVSEIIKLDNYFVVGVGNPKLRSDFTDRMSKIGGVVFGLRSPQAYISNFDVVLGEGVDIMHGAFISNSVQIEQGTLINRFANISHDVQIGRYCEISPQANILGGAVIGNYCSIGASAVILPKIRVGANSVVGAGAVVIKNVEENTIVAGNPAKIINKKL